MIPFLRISPKIEIAININIPSKQAATMIKLKPNATKPFIKPSKTFIILINNPDSFITLLPPP